MKSSFKTSNKLYALLQSRCFALLWLHFENLIFSEAYNFKHKMNKLKIPQKLIRKIINILLIYKLEKFTFTKKFYVHETGKGHGKVHGVDKIQID